MTYRAGIEARAREAAEAARDEVLHAEPRGLGDAAAELVPKTPPHVGVCLVGGDRPLARSAARRPPGRW